jgi:hypothetical protein
MQMSPKILLLAGTLVLWGLQTGFHWMSLFLAGAVVASGLVKRPLSFTQREFARLWDVTLLVLVGAAIYQRQTSSISGAVLAFLQWLPMLLFPMTAAFLFSHTKQVPFSTFVFWWRGREKGDDRTLDLSYGYLGICLLSASAGTTRGAWFYPAATGIIAVALLLNRPRRLHGATTFVLLAVVAGTGYVLQGKWRDLQTEFESKTVSWFAGFFPRQFEDQETHTSFGEVAKLKNSGRLIMQIEVAPSSAPPRLLRQVSFDQYRRGAWLSTRRAYSPVLEASHGSWNLSVAPDATNSAMLSMLVPEGRVLLPLPAGAARARDLLAARLERNRFGNVRVWDCDDPLKCAVEFEGTHSYDPAPLDKDLQVPVADEAVVEEIMRELDLRAIPPEEVLRRVGSYFAEQFSYDARLPATAQGPTEASFVAQFLRETRAGHCEYFATSAALILRKAGIPTRYALGFAAVEPDEAKRSYRVRERHAHAWVLAYVNGRWIDFDPTPGAWPAIEAREQSLFARFSDWWANVKFKVATTRLLPDSSIRIAWWVGALAVVLLTWKLWRRKRTVRPHHASSLSRAYAWPGLDSEFFEIERSLVSRGLNRKGNETTVAWLARIARQCPASDALRELAGLHYKYRFDPCGLTFEERQALAQNARDWLNRETAIETTSGRGG